MHESADVGERLLDPVVSILACPLIPIGGQQRREGKGREEEPRYIVVQRIGSSWGAVFASRPERIFLTKHKKGLHATLQIFFFPHFSSHAPTNDPGTSNHRRSLAGWPLFESTI
jgi:hypothetical protein